MLPHLQHDQQPFSGKASSSFFSMHFPFKASKGNSRSLGYSLCLSYSLWWGSEKAAGDGLRWTERNLKDQTSCCSLWWRLWHAGEQAWSYQESDKKLLFYLNFLWQSIRVRTVHHQKVKHCKFVAFYLKKQHKKKMWMYFWWYPLIILLIVNRLHVILSVFWNTQTGLFTGTS